MCGSIVDIQSATAEIKRGKKKKERSRKKKPQDENIMSASATQGSHNKCYDVGLYICHCDYGHVITYRFFRITMSKLRWLLIFPTCHCVINKTAVAVMLRRCTEE